MADLEMRLSTEVGTISYSDLEKLPSFIDEALRQIMPIDEQGNFPPHAVSASNLPEAKDTLAKLRKLDKALEDERKRIKKEWLKPYEDFEATYKSRKQALTIAIENLDSDVKAVETDISNFKRNGLTLNIQKDADAMRAGLGDLVKDNPALWSRVWSESYLNKTMSSTKVCEAYRTALRDIMTELETIDASEDREKLLQAYYRLGNLTLALAEVQRFKDLEKKYKAKTQAIEEQEAFVPQTVVVEAPKDEDGFTYKSFRCWHKDATAFKGLIQYMKDNGFHCEILK